MNIKKNNSGFSILEIIAAIFVITLGMIGVLSLIVQNIQVQYINRNTIIASQLAQEGLELVRNKRDANWINGNEWNENLDPGTYKVDYSGTFSIVGGIDETTLQKSSDNFYKYDSLGNNSIFKRMISISQVDPDQISVNCVIKWTERGRTREYAANTILYNWK